MVSDVQIAQWIEDLVINFFADLLLQVEEYNLTCRNLFYKHMPRFLSKPKELSLLNFIRLHPQLCFEGKEVH